MTAALLTLAATALVALVVVALRWLYRWWDRQMNLDLDNWDPDTTDTPIFAGVVADLGCIEVVAFAGLVERYVAGRSPQTSQPQGLGNQEGEPDGNKMGVHPGRTRQGAEGLDRRGVHGGSSVLDRSGSDPSSGRAESPGRRGLSVSIPAGHESAGVDPNLTASPGATS